MRLRTQVVGEEGVRRALDLIAQRMGDLRPVWRDIVADYKSVAKGVFDSQGANIGEHWAPLSPRYAEWKRRHFGGGLNVRSGHLRATAEGRTSDFRQTISALAAEVRIGDPAAPYVQAVRPFLRVGEFEKRRWLRILVAYAERVASTARA